MVRFLYVESDGFHFNKNENKLRTHASCRKALAKGLVDILWARSVDDALRLMRTSKAQGVPIHAVISGTRLTGQINKQAGLRTLAECISAECPSTALFVMHTPPSYEPANGVIRSTSEQYIVKSLGLRPKQIFHRYHYGLPDVIMIVLKRAVDVVKARNESVFAAQALKAVNEAEKSPKPVKARGCISAHLDVQPVC